MKLNDRAGKLKTKFLVGRHVTLGVLSARTDFNPYAGWINDQDTVRYMAAGRFPAGVGELKAHVRAHAASKNGLLLGIFLNKTKRHIGNISLNDIKWKDRHGEIGLLIGDKRSRGKGYATEAIRLLVEHSFTCLNLHKLYCGMVSGNEASRRAFLRVGFKEEGLLREHFYLDGSYLDCHRLGLLRDNYVRARTTNRSGGR